MWWAIISNYSKTPPFSNANNNVRKTRNASALNSSQWAEHIKPANTSKRVIAYLTMELTLRHPSVMLISIRCISGKLAKSVTTELIRTIINLRNTQQRNLQVIDQPKSTHNLSHITSQIPGTAAHSTILRRSSSKLKPIWPMISEPHSLIMAKTLLTSWPIGLQVVVENGDLTMVIATGQIGIESIGEKISITTTEISWQRFDRKLIRDKYVL